MICRKCGELIHDSAKFCSVCGAPQQDDPKPSRSVMNPAHTHYERCTAEGHAAPGANIGFIGAVKLFFRNYANFSGRSRRSEYWYAYLFTLLLAFFVGFVDESLLNIAYLAIFVPTLSLSVRRLHDIGKSGWWYLAAFIPLVGGILLLIWHLTDSQPGENQWGPSPKY